MFYKVRYFMYIGKVQIPLIYLYIQIYISKHSYFIFIVKYRLIIYEYIQNNEFIYMHELLFTVPYKQMIFNLTVLHYF